DMLARQGRQLWQNLVIRTAYVIGQLHKQWTHMSRRVGGVGARSAYRHMQNWALHARKQIPQSDSIWHHKFLDSIESIIRYGRTFRLKFAAQCTFARTGCVLQINDYKGSARRIYYALGHEGTDI